MTYDIWLYDMTCDMIYDMLWYDIWLYDMTCDMIYDTIYDMTWHMLYDKWLWHDMWYDI